MFRSAEKEVVAMFSRACTKVSTCIQPMLLFHASELEWILPRVVGRSFLFFDFHANFITFKSKQLSHQAFEHQDIVPDYDLRV